MSDEPDKPDGKRPKWKRIARIAAVLAILLAIYVSGYFVLSKYAEVGALESTPPPKYTFIGLFRRHYREFPNETIRTMYIPMAWLECKIRGQSVCVTTPKSEDIDFYPDALW
jgi:hypothetical protein